MHVNFTHAIPGMPTEVVWSADLERPPHRGEMVLLHRGIKGAAVEGDSPFNTPPERFRAIDVVWHYAPGHGDVYVDVSLARVSTQEDLERAAAEAHPPRALQQQLFAGRKQ